MAISLILQYGILEKLVTFVWEKSTFEEILEVLLFAKNMFNIILTIGVFNGI